MKKNKFNAVERLIRKSGTFLLSTHRNSDADAIGSEIALALGLKKIGKEVEIINNSKTPENLKFLPFSDIISKKFKASNKYDAAILLDCENPERNGHVVNKKKILHAPFYIDHHITNKQNPDENLIIPTVSSTSEIVYKLLKHLNVKIDGDMATCIYAGIFFDTGGLRYSNAGESAYKICYNLVKMGVPVRTISKQLFEKRSYSSQLLLALALSRLEINEEKKFCWTYVTEKDYEKTGAGNSDTDGFIDQLNQTEGMDASIFFREVGKNHTKVSLRSTNSIDVAEIASHFGGGGHKKASGFLYKENIRKTITLVLKEICESS